MGDADKNGSSAAAAAGGDLEVNKNAGGGEEEEQSKKQKLNGDAPTEVQRSSSSSDPVGGVVVDPTSSTDNDNDESSSKMECCTTTEGSSSSNMMTQEDQEPPPPPLPEEERIGVTVMYNKNPIQLTVSLSSTVGELKKQIQERTGVDPAFQKVLLKGIAKDECLLKDLGVTVATKKILVIGSSMEDVLGVRVVPTDGGGSASSAASSEKSDAGNWCSLTNHKKVIDKGLPEDVMPGILNEHDGLPPFPLHGMYSSKGSKVRLTFKLENDELWIGTKERTEKVPIGSIRNVTSQPITGYEHYHIVAIQLGPTEASRFFVYWVPAQYVDAIKDALTGP